MPLRRPPQAFPQKVKEYEVTSHLCALLTSGPGIAMAVVHHKITQGIIRPQSKE